MAVDEIDPIIVDMNKFDLVILAMNKIHLVVVAVDKVNNVVRFVAMRLTSSSWSQVQPPPCGHG